MQLFDWETSPERGTLYRLELSNEQLIPRHPRLHKTIIDRRPQFRIPFHTVALDYHGFLVEVHIENTMCSECGERNGPCAVLTFDFGYKEKLELLSRFTAPLFRCFHCHEIVRRRIILWRAQDEETPYVWELQHGKWPGSP